MEDQRTVWRSQFGFLMAAIGSAVGLGNIWRFSYMCYENGGGAFMVPYFVALLTTGIPLMLLEYALGHKKHGSSALSFAKIGRKYEWLGWWMPIFVMFGIMLYYSVIIGWCFNFTLFSLDLSWGADTQNFFLKEFLGLSKDVFHPGGIQLPILLSTALVWVIIWFICYKEVNHGIERACEIFMPTLLILTAILVFWGLSLDGAKEGILYYLKPDFSKIWDPKVWIAAYGQIFFTLSLGFGIMIAYASYLPKKTDLVKNAFLTSIANCGYSFFAGFAVFSVLGYMAMQKGVAIPDVIKSGPTLAFVVYPEAISRLPVMNSLFGFIFFLALVIAGLSSGISIIEAICSAILDKFNKNNKIKRKGVVSALCLAGFLGGLIFTTQGGLYFLDIVDHFLTQYGLVVAGLLECVVIGWILKAAVLRRHINAVSGWKINKIWDFLIRYFIPAVLVIMVIQSISSDTTSPYYGGYPSSALLWLGVGWIIITALLAVVITLPAWEPEKLKYEHIPEEEHLLL